MSSSESSSDESEPLPEPEPPAGGVGAAGRVVDPPLSVQAFVAAARATASVPAEYVIVVLALCEDQQVMLTDGDGAGAAGWVNDPPLSVHCFLTTLFAATVDTVDVYVI